MRNAQILIVLNEVTVCWIYSASLNMAVQTGKYVKVERKKENDTSDMCPSLEIVCLRHQQTRFNLEIKQNCTKTSLMGISQPQVNQCFRIAQLLCFVNGESRN